MLEQLLIFTRGGLILWTCKELGNALKGSPIDTLIRSCLLEERSGAASYNYDAPGAACTLKWTFHNELGLVFVAVYQTILHLLYVNDLLAILKQEFSEIYDPKRTVYNDFDDVFRQLRKEAETRAEEMKKSKQVSQLTNRNIGKKQGQVQKSGLRGGNEIKSDRVSGNDDGDGENLKGKKENGPANGNHIATNKSPFMGIVVRKGNGSSDAGVFDVNKLPKLRVKGGKKTDTVVNKSSKEDPKKKIIKKNKVWNDSPEEPKSDFTDPISENGEENIAVVAADEGESMMDKEEIIISESETEEDKEAEKDSKVETKKKRWFSSMFQSIAGKANLEKADLEPALKALKDRLMTKNVFAHGLRLRKSLRNFMNLWQQVWKEQSKPYVVVFVGVNGVGKATNLAKVTYWLLQHEVNVVVAACDTFRSGAVEQLRTHARRLQIPIFEKGYEKDPAIVAKEAIQEATRNGSDVVLVDTAGRMQKLAELSTSPNPRLVDGILLTKFDTIDDKVGAALSMVYISGAPVIFVGCGQSFTDLKKLSVKSIVKTLLK
ncbi:signal recognition particle receptor alpha subunit family protein [Actinidia rufa]|uniref:Signal recognition particle receptor alpha subunit family protein n=1 Tax=Actinidia rufa TaxID=165716 RepID=A0A7J0DNQ1_9ERIC|nr:signal recognition particle receptor alpha subunit family protein [Actinidia rufa]